MSFSSFSSSSSQFFRSASMISSKVNHGLCLSSSSSSLLRQHRYVRPTTTLPISRGLSSVSSMTKWTRSWGEGVKWKGGGREVGYLVHLQRKNGFASQPQIKNPVEIHSSGGLADQALTMKIAQAQEQSKEEEEAKKAAENQIRALKFTFYAMAGIVGGMGAWIFFTYGAPTLDQDGNPIEDEFSHMPYLQQYWNRSSAEVRNYINYIVNPSRDKLLPDPLKAPYYQPPYTLLLELNGVLVHPEWTYKTGWRFKKRPGVDYFLNQVTGYTFEVVVFTHEPGLTAFPIVEALDKQGCFHYRLFRDSTKYQNGTHVKDLEKLNRDLSKVIMVDCNEKALAGHRSNALILPKWEGNDDDRVLFDLAALINAIGTSELKDIRGVLEYYSKFPDPVAEFRSKQQELAKKEQEIKKPEVTVSSTLNPTGIIGSLFRKS